MLQNVVKYVLSFWPYLQPGRQNAQTEPFETHSDDAVFYRMFDGFKLGHPETGVFPGSGVAEVR